MMLGKKKKLQVQNKGKILIYGDSGVGKTLMFSIAPKPLYINFEGGSMSLNIIEKWFDYLDIEEIKPNSIKELNDLFMELKDTQHDRQTVILDSLTEIEKVLLDEVLASPKRDSKLDKNIPTLQEYLKVQNQLRKIIRLFRDLDMHVIFISLATEQKNQMTGETKIQPKIFDKVAVDLMGYVDIVGYLFVAEDGTRKLLTQPKGKFQAKDRTGQLGFGLNDATTYHLIEPLGNEIPEEVQNIVKYIKETANKAPQAKQQPKKQNIKEK